MRPWPGTRYNVCCNFFWIATLFLMPADKGNNSFASWLLVYSYTHNIEALSCDEALVDATNLLVELGVTPDDLARAIREDIKEKTGCSASVGMGKIIYLLTRILFQTFMTYMELFKNVLLSHFPAIAMNMNIEMKQKCHKSSIKLMSYIL